MELKKVERSTWLGSNDSPELLLGARTSYISQPQDCALKAEPLAPVLLAPVESISLMNEPVAGGSKVLSLCLAAGNVCTRHCTLGSYFDLC
jgi:hypothetical protein